MLFSWWKRRRCSTGCSSSTVLLWSACRVHRFLRETIKDRTSRATCFNWYRGSTLVMTRLKNFLYWTTTYTEKTACNCDARPGPLYTTFSGRCKVAASPPTRSDWSGQEEACWSLCFSPRSSSSFAWIDSIVTTDKEYCLPIDNTCNHCIDLDALPIQQAKHPDHREKLFFLWWDINDRSFRNWFQPVLHWTWTRSAPSWRRWAKPCSNVGPGGEKLSFSWITQDHNSDEHSEENWRKLALNLRHVHHTHPTLQLPTANCHVFRLFQSFLVEINFI